MTQTKLYNVMFPIWLLLFLPTPVLPITVVVNFLIDSLVLILCLKALKLEIKPTYKKKIWAVWGFGFLADIIGAGVLFLALILGDKFNQQLGSDLSINAFESPLATAVMVLSIALAGALIYVFNRYITFKKSELSQKQKHIISLVLAIATAPYTYCIPLNWIYN